MTPPICDSIEIAATISLVWEATIDVEAVPDHTPTMTAVELLDPPPLTVGSRVRIKQPLQRAKIWTVDVLDHEHRFAWSTTWFGTRMTASHDLIASANGTTNTLSVEFGGTRARLLAQLLAQPIRGAIAKENRGLKESIETDSGASIIGGAHEDDPVIAD